VINRTQALAQSMVARYSPVANLLPDFVVGTNATPKPAPANYQENQPLNFPATANWDTWTTVTTTAPLTAGTNTIRVTAVTAGGDANLDALTVS
jgi:hypothetical protein